MKYIERNQDSSLKSDKTATLPNVTEILVIYLWITAARRNRLLRVTWAKTTAQTWPAAVNRVWTLFVLIETGFRQYLHLACRTRIEGLHTQCVLISLSAKSVTDF